jgi:hypothetical protein
MANTSNGGTLEWKLHGASPPDFLGDGREHWFGIVTDGEGGYDVSAIARGDGQLTVSFNWHAGPNAGKARLWHFTPSPADRRTEAVLRFTWEAQEAQLAFNGRVVTPWPEGFPDGLGSS